MKELGIATHMQKQRKGKKTLTLLRSNEKFFVSKIIDGTLTISKKGKLYNNRTKRFVGAKSKTGRYHKFSMSENGRKGPIHHIQLHRLVWVWFKGNIKDGFEINHKDGDVSNNRLKNLEVVTPAENSIHAIRRGLKPSNCGFKNGNAAFNTEDVDMIRVLHKEGWSIKEIARNYEVCRQTISDVVHNKRYVR